MTSAEEILQLIDELRYYEGASVLILCKNPDFNRQKNEAIVCQAPFTNWKEERFDGDTLVETLRKAAKAQATRPPEAHVAKAYKGDIPLNDGWGSDGDPRSED